MKKIVTVAFFIVWPITGIMMESHGVDQGWVYMTVGGLLGGIYGIILGLE